MEEQDNELQVIEDSYDMATTVSNDGYSQSFILEYPEFFDADFCQTIIDKFNITAERPLIGVVKYSDGTSDINTNSYLELEVKNDSDNFTSSSAFDFREIEYSLKQEDYDLIGDGNIKTFVIKVCLFGNDDEVPAVKDLRAVALD